MRDEDWRHLNDEALQRVLIERWLYRGLMLAVVFAAAVIVSWLASRGLSGTGDRVTVGVLLALAIAAAAVAFYMRQQDLKIHRELLRRRQSPPSAASSRSV